MATDDKSSSSSSTDWSVEPAGISPTSPSHLTHFKPLTPEQDEPPLRSAYSSFVNLFRFNNKGEEIRTSTGSGKSVASLSNHDPRTAVQLRTALKRLKEIMEGKSQDSDLKQYWMPDSQCKECYDCNEKFTTFRRRHHCRLCGQIFCSRCCNQEIPGKFMGYTGDLRACTYCRKLALNYAHSADSGSIGEDLSALSDSPSSVCVLEPSEPRTPLGGRKSSRNIFLEEDLTWQSMIHQEPQNSGLTSRLTTLQEDVGKSPVRKRSASVTTMTLDRSVSSMVPSYDSSVSPPTSRSMSGTKSGTKLDHSEEERKILLDSSQLKDLWKKICHNSTGMEFQDHRYWLRTYPNCIVGKELVNWLLRNGTISTRAQAIAIGQALVDGRWIDCVTHHDQLFRDEYALYRPLQSTEFSETPSPDSDSVNSLEGHSEPSWFKDIKFDDSDTEQLADETEYAMPKFLLSEDGVQNIVITDAFIKESLFNRRVEEKAKEMMFTPLGWHHSSLDQLREENGEKKAMERLLSANHSHMMALLQQLLYSESLSLSWRDIIVPVVRQVVQTVRPDVRNCDDDMDIRQLVHIKKIPGGKKFDSIVVNGFVCTKNIAHKKMNPYIKNPRILMLKCSIEYLYREETKFTSIDPIVLQEREFLKNYVQRIVDVRPNLVLVEKTVSRIAQDMLLEHGITLVINVKPQVLDRVSHMTQGDLVMSMDQLLTKPRLGTCHKFYMQPFILANSEVKTLMFFEGCPPHLGCSIKLRGASEYELARVKEIIMLMVCVAYHSQLEISFLMDEFAMPPSLAQSTSFPCLLEGAAASEEEEDGESPGSENNEESPGKTAGSEDSASAAQTEDEGLLLDSSSKNGDLEALQEKLNPKSPTPSVRKDEAPAATRTSSPFSNPPAPPFSVSPPFLMEEDQEMTGSDTLIAASDGDMGGEATLLKQESLGLEDGDGSETPTPKLFRDPLQDDTGMFVAEQVASSDDRLKSISAVFKQELKDVILCISPFITFKEPFLLTPAGMHCPSRDYFPEQVYLSPLLNKDLKELDVRRKRQLLKDSAPSSLVGGQTNGIVQPRPIEFLPCHSLTSTRIVEQLSNSQNLAEMLADYRAKGGRIRQKETHDPFNSAAAACIEVFELILYFSHPQLDCLNPINHQRLCVLFSSSSIQSNNAPNPCVSPCFMARTTSLWVPSYQCPSMFCETPMVHHVRRFVHGNGCVQIVLKELDSPVPGYQHTILNYSWCRICKQVTPVVPLSNDSWCMSFAKYLELRFYGHQYSRRANAEPCGHSIHKDYHQYFSYNQMVASFSYTSIKLLEICLPRPKIFIRNLGPSKTNLQQDLKDFTQKVTQVYLAIDDRLTSLKTETFSKTREEKMEDIFAQKDMEEAELRSWIEKLQVRLQVCGSDSPQQLQAVLESLVVKKQSLCEMLQSWNSRLQDLFQQEKGKKRLSVPPSPGRHRPNTSAVESSPRNPSPVVQNGEKGDRSHLSPPLSSRTLSACQKVRTPPLIFIVFRAPLPLLYMPCACSLSDVFEGHLLGSTDSQVKEKSTMKAILANFLPGNSYNPIPFPFDPDKHYLMYEHERVPIAVCEREPSSIIAFALSCKEYKTALDDLSKVSNAGGEETSQPSRYAAFPPELQLCASKSTVQLLAYFCYLLIMRTWRCNVSILSLFCAEEADSADKQKKQALNPHVELQFSDANAKFYCRVYYAKEFHKMREEIMESSEEDFVRSLSHCVNWQARGGKSGAVFYATEDDRFILKQMPRLEVQSFLDFAPHYFTYITGAVQQKRPTALAKILGVYRIGYKNSQNNTEKKLDLLVMENLFYGRKMAQVFDLKGSLRNRNVKTESGKESCEVVLLDENLLKLIHDNPLYIRSHCKSILRAAIHSDAYFLSSHLIIDYSLLVGRDDATEQLVVGIIDYIRTFTWDKRLEMVVKSTGILGGQGKMPTVVSPELYRARFCEAMDKYFLMVPDHWTGLGTNC
uniref:1-phosphatidylinositol 3-phosphate 5-kinase n=1 Tax=Pundamilia nyererei TaxID=303518 RepID=A0A3B4G9P8_9CICH